LKEFGDKLSAGNKSAINNGLEKLKTAHKNQDEAGIDAAMNELNAAWQAASTEMYQGGAQAEGGPTAGAGSANSNDPNSNVSDVEYEEVNDSKK
jgi:molecular chaperone DnaK